MGFGNKWKPLLDALDGEKTRLNRTESRKRFLKNEIHLAATSS